MRWPRPSSRDAVVLESLSMVALEAWALGKPVLANAKCDVLKGEALCSNVGSTMNATEVRRGVVFDRLQRAAQRGARPERRDVFPDATTPGP